MRLEDLQAKRDQILAIAEEYGATNIRVFGSVVRGEAHPESDVDLLVQYTQQISLLDHIGFKQALEDYLGCKVDLVTKKSLHWVIRDRVMQEAVPL